MLLLYNFYNIIIENSYIRLKVARAEARAELIR